MEIPGLGPVTHYPDCGQHVSQPVRVPMLGGECTLVLEGYDTDRDREAFHAAIANFLAATRDVLSRAEEHVYRYCQRCMHDHAQQEAGPDIRRPSDVWAHVQFGFEAIVSRRHRGDRAVYVSLECNCDWEVEHGLQLVFREGREISKIGPYDGHLTNADAFGDPALEHVIYR